MQDESYRNQLIDSAAAAYARGVIDQSAFESLVTRLNQTGSQLELISLANGLPAVFGAALPATAGPTNLAPLWEDISLSSGNLKKTGEWVSADGYEIELRSSNLVLDFMAYDGVSGFRLAIDINLISSNCRILVPDNWTVELRLEDNFASNVKNKGQSTPWGDNLIVVSGSLKSSNLKVKYK